MNHGFTEVGEMGWLGWRGDGRSQALGALLSRLSRRLVLGLCIGGRHDEQAGTGDQAWPTNSRHDQTVLSGHETPAEQLILSLTVYLNSLILESRPSWP